MLHVYLPEFYGGRLTYFMASPVVSLTCTFCFLWQHWLHSQYFTIVLNSFWDLVQILPATKRRRRDDAIFTTGERIATQRSCHETRCRYHQTFIFKQHLNFCWKYFQMQHSQPDKLILFYTKNLCAFCCFYKE